MLYLKCIFLLIFKIRLLRGFVPNSISSLIRTDNTRTRLNVVSFVGTSSGVVPISLDNSNDGLSNTNSTNCKINEAEPKPKPNTVYVYNLPKQISEKEIHELFSKYGNVESMNAPMERNGLSKGYAFVNMSTPEELNKVVAQNEMRAHGHKIAAKKARPRKFQKRHDQLFQFRASFRRGKNYVLIFLSNQLKKILNCILEKNRSTKFVESSQETI